MFSLRAPGKKPISITTTTASTFLYWSPESSPTTVTSPIDMDPIIWSSLPNHILDHILSFLPFKTLVALRSVSQHLRSLILSPTFLSDHSFSLPSFLLLSHPQSFNSFPLFEFNLHSWRTLPLPRSLSLTCASSLLSSSHGLLCFSVSSSSVSSLSIFNPLTRSSRSVKFPFYPFPFELLSLIASLSVLLPPPLLRDPFASMIPVTTHGANSAMLIKTYLVGLLKMESFTMGHSISSDLSLF